MKPAAFEYYAPAGLDEALKLFGDIGDGAMALAGGQTLMPLLNMRLAAPAALVDLNGIDELAHLAISESELRVGAMVRHMTLEHDAAVRKALPLLCDVAGHIAHVQIRTRGTIGGSLASAAPAAEWPAVAAVLDARLVVRGASGEQRSLTPEDFFDGAMTTTLAPDELLVEIRLPIPEADTGWGFVEFARRHGDFALAGAAALVSFDAGGKIDQARLAMCGLSEPGVRLRAAEEALLGCTGSEGDLVRFEELVRDAVDVGHDFQLGAPSRRRLAGVIARRALSQAVERSRGRSRA